MTPRQFYKSQSKERIRAVVAAAGTTFDNFKQIAISKGSVSARLALALQESSDGEMTVLEILYPAAATESRPDVFGPAPEHNEEAA